MFKNLSRGIALGAIATLVSCGGVQSSTTTPDNSLFYNQPAAQWEETLPLGNGRLGMMPDGGVESEKIVLNEISMWSGSVADYSNPEAGKSLPAIRELLFEGKNREAQELMYKKFVPRKSGDGATYGTFQMLADMNVEYTYPQDAEPQNYTRSLNLENSLAQTDFSVGEVEYSRTYFASRTKDVLVVCLEADADDAISFKVGVSRPKDFAVESQEDGSVKFFGELQSGQSGVDGVKYASYVDVVAEGDNVKKNTGDGTIELIGADKAWILVSAATSFFEGEDYDKRALELLTEAKKSDLESVEAKTIEDYQSLYNRAKLTLASDSKIANLPTDKRIEEFVNEDDPALAALYYNYGRYLLISSTREGSLPPNLQGLWANKPSTPWNGDYHTNINVQMNHWGAEQGNLSELHLPLVELTEGLVESGEHSAKVFYGDDARGWVLHMMTNVWQYTAPGSHPSWGATNTGGAWLCAHLWEHYLFGCDKEYLKRIYPVMRGAAEFFLSTMVEEPQHGWLVTAPTSSPENGFLLGDNPEPVSVCMAPTMDIQLVSELYGNVIEAAKILDIDSDYRAQLEAALDKFPPYQISEGGYLMEWLEDYKEQDIHHRHVSHLYGLHPGNQISLNSTPELAEACKQTLNRRGDGGTGWSRAWKINFWARLGDGDRAYTLFKSLMQPAYDSINPMKHGSGTFPNLFCSHQPFQIDGNWGGTSGISEMVLQSQDGFVNFLPALPSVWKEGSFSGFRVRGGATVSLEWKDGVAKSATITADNTSTIKVKRPNGVSKVEAKSAKETKEYTEEFIELTFEKGEEIELNFI